jgi:hypothetical protein
LFDSYSNSGLANEEQANGRDYQPQRYAWRERLPAKNSLPGISVSASCGHLRWYTQRLFGEPFFSAFSSRATAA